MSGWFAASSSSISLIHSFWLVALAAAERIATSPLSPICSAIRSTWLLAMPAASAWLTKTSRNCGSVSESIVTTLVPALRASSRASPMAVGSLAETTSAPARCWVAVLMKLTWESGVDSVGPTCDHLVPISFAAFLPPASEASK